MLRRDRTNMMRARWAAIGAAVAVTLGAGGILAAGAASPDASSFVPVVPCRLLDTRDAAVGGRSAPLQAGETLEVSVRGTHGNCTIPATANGVAANVTTANGTSASFLSIWPTDGSQPTASTNNWAAGDAPDPNKVDIKLSSAGQMSIYNKSGTVDVIIDVVGYYELAASGGQSSGAKFFTTPAGTNGVVLDGTDQTLATLTVNAPGTGTIVVTATMQVSNFDLAASQTVVCDLVLASDAPDYLQNDLSTGDRQIISLSEGFSVTAGANTVRLVCNGTSTTQLIAFHPRITAVFSSVAL